MSSNVETMNVIQLKALARERGIKGYYKLRKAELIDLLSGDALVVSRPVQAPKGSRPPTPTTNDLIDFNTPAKRGKILQIKHRKKKNFDDQLLPKPLTPFNKINKKINEWYDWYD